MREAGLRILVVDDEPAMVGAVAALVGSVGHRVTAAYDGREALRRYGEEQPDVVLLDLAMPGEDGLAVCRAIRRRGSTPIIVVSGEGQESAKVEALDAGADDYVTKPFGKDELLARIRAVIRRRSPSPDADDGQPSIIEVDPSRHEARARDRPLRLTRIEFALLDALVSARARLVSQADLLEAGWPGEHDPDPLWLKPHLARLRRKLSAARAPAPIAVRGVGYRLIDPPLVPRVEEEAHPPR
jgi:two-component system, OmpR family, KDP operon response regulator KdpE